MLMPITAMGEHCHLSTRENNIGSDFTDFATQPESVAESVKGFSSEDFGFRIATANI